MLRCQGYTYDEIIFVLNRKHKIKTTKGTLSKWMKEYNPPYFQIMDMNKRYKRVVLSWLFTHNDLNYDYKIHLPKLTFCNKRFPDLKSYLLNLPDFIDHSRFADNNRCSQMKLYTNPGVQKQTYTELSAMVLNALTFRAKVPRSEIRCAWFDEQHWHEFSP